MKFNKKILKNGLRVVTVPMPDNPSVTVLVMVEAGSKYEQKDNNGISHFLEHMVFKGTPRRPKASEISKELDSIGAHYNAFTGYEYTGYYAKADIRHTDKLIDVVSDMYLNPLFEQSEIDKERGVIIEEMRMYQDLPQRHVHDVLAGLLYKDQPAGWNIVGNEQNLRAFNREHFVEYRKNHYVSSATTVIVSGNINEKEIIKKIEKAFALISNGKKKGKLPVKESQKNPEIKAEYKETDQTHLVVAMRTFPIDDPKMPVLQVLATILGGGMSSRLFSKMRDQLGICYYVKTSVDPFTDHGAISISAGVDNSRVEQGIKGILGEIKRMKTEPVPADELQKAKDYLAGTTMLELETSDARAEFSGLQETLRRKIENPADFIKKIKKVTAGDVKKLANQIFVDKGLNMAIIGKYKDSTPFTSYFTLK